MREENWPYCIPDKRELTHAELSLLEFLLQQVEAIDIPASELKVVARCGCGSCPTILLGRAYDDEPITSRDSERLLDWSGKANNGTLVGIGMFAKDGIPTELEAWSMNGGDVKNWPPLDAISRDG